MRLSTNGHADGTANGEGPPPSTLAAQLVRDHTESKPRIGDATFSQLLQEILGSQHAPELDPTINFRLIQVIAEAGLDVLHTHDPFVRRDELAQQAADSLAVMTITLRRSPELIFYDSLGVPTNPPVPNLLQWLLPKLLRGLFNDQAGDLRKPTAALLGSLLQALGCSLDYWQHVEPVLDHYAECIEAVIEHIELPQLASRSFAISVPYDPISNGKEVAPSNITSLILGTLPDAIAAAILLCNAIAAACDALQGSTPRPFGRFLRMHRLADLTARLCQLLPKQNDLMAPARLHALSKLSLASLAELVTSAQTCSDDDVLRQVIALFCQQVVHFCAQPEAQSSNTQTRDFISQLMPSLERLFVRGSPGRYDYIIKRTGLATLLATLVKPSDDWDQHSATTLAQTTIKIRQAVETATDRPCTESVPDRAIKTDSSRLVKRRKYRCRTTCGTLPYPSILAELTQLLTGRTEQEIEGMAKIVDAVYPKLTEAAKSRFWKLLSMWVCTHGTTSVVESSTCTLCGADPCLRFADHRYSPDADNLEWVELRSILCTLTKSSAMQDSKHWRCMLTTAIRSFVLHDLHFTHSLDQSPLGDWCLKALSSSVRELRMTAARALSAFMHRGQEQGIRAGNRRIVLDFLRTLSQKTAIINHEAIVCAWGQVAVVCGDAELELALLRLVDYLGCTNDYICALAYNEILAISQVLERPLQDIFRPFWGSIAVSVVRESASVPQKMQLFAEALGMSVSQFLSVTQRHTLPVMVLTRQAAVVKRIAAARGPDVSVQHVCLQVRSNAAAILARLLVQPASDVEGNACAILSDLVPGFSEVDLGTVIKLDQLMVAVEIFKFAGEEDEQGKSRAYRGIQLLVKIADRRSSQPKPGQKQKQSKLLSVFFEAYVLGIMNHFSEIISRLDNTPRQEKMLCLKAISEMIILAKADILVAVPQIRACLQAAVDQEGLLDHAISTWLILVRHIDDVSVIHLVDHLLAVLVPKWGDLSHAVQSDAHETVGWLLSTHSKIISQNVLNMPSLAGVDVFSKYDNELRRLKDVADFEYSVAAFVIRLRNENLPVISKALQELEVWLRSKQQIVHEATLREPPVAEVTSLVRTLLDLCVQHSRNSSQLADAAGTCLGYIGCQDPNRIEATVTRRDTIITSNFDKANEVVDFIAVLFEDVLVPAFESSANSPRAQGFLAYAMQELLQFAEFKEAIGTRGSSLKSNPTRQRWFEMPEHIRNILTPFLTSHYVVNSISNATPTFPIFSTHLGHAKWLRTWTGHLLRSAHGDNAKAIFPILARAIRSHDLSISRFLLPFTALNIILGGIVKEVEAVVQEMLVVLNAVAQTEEEDSAVRASSEDIFAILDYMSRWLQEKKKEHRKMVSTAKRTGQTVDELTEAQSLAQMESVEDVLSLVPADITAKRAIDCGSYSRALFHWEQHLRAERDQGRSDHERTDLYEQLLSIYSKIDEPDGLDGLYAQLDVLTPEQQAFQHFRAGRWSAAQSWYEYELQQSPEDANMQVGLLACLKEAGQHNQLVTTAKRLVIHASATNISIDPRILSLAAQASWIANDNASLHFIIEQAGPDATDFDLMIGKVLLEAQTGGRQPDQLIDKARSIVTKSLTNSNTATLQLCHRPMLQLHALCEMHILADSARFVTGQDVDKPEVSAMLQCLDKRLEILGAHAAEKQYLLGIRRAMLNNLSSVTSSSPSSNTDPIRLPFAPTVCGKYWLTTAKLARHSDISKLAHFAVLKSSALGEGAARLEHARLLWKDNQHRPAIRSLERAITARAFSSYDMLTDAGSMTEDVSTKPNILMARAHLLLAKWQDQSGQYQVMEVREQYQNAARYFARWEKGHYYLGKHYVKLWEAEKALPSAKRSDRFVNGENIRLIIENYVRSIPFGTKYWHQTLPKLITLWLDLGADCAVKGNTGAHVFESRNKNLSLVHAQLKKYFERVPPYVFYTALPQIISRISHPNKAVFEVLSDLIVKIVQAHPSQALWAVIPVTKATSADRAKRGTEIIHQVCHTKSKSSSAMSTTDLRTMIMQAQRLQDALLHVCDVHYDGKASLISLTKDLKFNHKAAPCSLVVPFQDALTANIPAVHDASHIRQFRAFAQDKVTISSIQDEVLVLSSLMRPRKLTVRGSDGQLYGLLCKPKDDLRKDQRLMEFNTMINRALKRDAESSKRHLYIRTYGVTPLSEESGTIEWVEGIKPLRDILMNLYIRRGVTPNYPELRNLLNEASIDPKNVGIFTNQVLGIYKPVLHEWFVASFPEPHEWFAARIRYTRSVAVMSMVGYVLGLGDRHGENVLLEEGSGGIFHVDFNCLFDKGLTFEKPEVVPFRLTHNMVDAMGAYGCQGPFRRSSEIVLDLLRQHMDALMNILETFVHDPTTDFVDRSNKKKRTNNASLGVPDSPQEVLDSVQGKLKGYLRGETVPLSVEGHVDALIKQATDPWNLCRLYIGWMACM